MEIMEQGMRKNPKKRKNQNVEEKSFLVVQ